jgi:hypothetical protein
VVLAPVAWTAGLQASRSWRRMPGPRRPIDGIAGGGAALLVAASAFGAVALAVGVVVVVAAAVVVDRTVTARWRAGRLRSVRHLGRTLLIAGAVGLAGGLPVVLRDESSHGAVVTLALFTFALAYDAGAYLFGSGARRRWEGPAAGVASIGAVTVAVAAILVPPFSGASPWVLGIAAAALAPLGPVAADVLLGDRRVRATGLRRLDSLIVLGPLWTVLALALVG